MVKKHIKGGALSVEDIQQFVDASYEKRGSAPDKIGDYILDKELSTRKAKVYHDPNTGKTVVANRGTTGTVSDWSNNLKYGADKLTGNMFNFYGNSDRMRNATDTQNKAISKYGKVDTNVGHSQSGIITRKLNDEGKTGEVINVNPASFFEDKKDNEYTIRSSFDPVSMFSKGATTVKDNTWNPLKAHSSKFLSNLDPRKLIGKGINKEEIQSVIFDRNHWTNTRAKNWLKKHDFKTEVDVKEHTLRYRQSEPIYNNYITKDIGNNIKMIIGFKDKMSVNGKGMKLTEDDIHSKIKKLAHIIHENRGHLNKHVILDSFHGLGCGISHSMEDMDDEEIDGGSVNRLNKFNRWTKALGHAVQDIGDYIKPVAKPIFEAGTRKAVEKINGYGMRGGGSRIKGFKEWTRALGNAAKDIGTYIKPVAEPILQAGTRKAVEKINGYGVRKRMGSDPRTYTPRSTGGRLVKGSPEAKARMAAMRAMKNK